MSSIESASAAKAVHPLAELCNVSVSFGSTSVFSGLSFALQPKEHLALVGANGSGKSTLLRLLQGELRLPQAIMTEQGEIPQPGKIYWGFNNTRDASALAARENVRLISPAQQRNYARQGWNITGEEIILSGLDNAAMIYGELASQHYERAGALAEAAGASHLLQMHAPAMSQGQLRMVLILRTLMAAPALLLLDEPFDGLDKHARKEVRRALELAAHQGGTLLVTAHRREDIPSFVQGILLLENGSIRKVSPDNLLALDSLISVSKPADTLEKGKTLDLTGRREVSSNKCEAAERDDFIQCLAASTSPLLELRHVDVYVERAKVLHDLNWQVVRGQQWVVSGPNGSGKSTLLRLLYGEEQAAYGGGILWCGHPRPPLEIFRSAVGYVSDHLQHMYDYDLNAEDIVVSGLKGTIGLYHEPSAEEQDVANYWLNFMGIGSLSQRFFHSLSTGQARRVLLARALASSPAVLLLDEPFSGLDAASRKLFLHALDLLAAKNVSLIFVSHNEQDTSDIFTHELCLEEGRITYCGPRKVNSSG